MTRKNRDDVFHDTLKILEDIHGDVHSRREATIEDAVNSIEDGALSAYSALRQLSQNGTSSAPSSSPRPTPVSANAPAPAKASLESPADTTHANAIKPEHSELPASISVVTGEGADFRERGHTKTFIIRRPNTPRSR